jgi:hypothetical protein
MAIRHVTAIILSGVTWFLIGIFLLTKGLNLLIVKAGLSDQLALILVVVGLLLGFLKGRLILAKTVKRVLGRITSLPNPCPIRAIYPRSYYFIILGMMGIGFVFRWLPASVHGLVDVAVGSALINGAVLYLRLIPKKAI